MGFFNSDILNSEYEDGSKVEEFDYVNIIRDKNTKTIINNEFVVYDSENSCNMGNGNVEEQEEDEPVEEEPTEEPVNERIITINFDANGGTIDSVKYNYTGDYQTFVANRTGYYKLETWGAQGGNASKYTGGYGGYSKGIVKLNKGDTLYIYVGGQGTTINKKSQGKIAGGYNGGGNGMSASSYYGAGGGGATHIATTKGLLSDHASNYTSTVLMVAGGGGGAYYKSYSGGNGGSTAGTGVNGGTQTAGGISTNTKYASDGSFGKGGSYIKSGYAAAGGGGGLYGGSAARAAISGGGSGYVNSSLISDYSTATSSHTGNGAARITYIKDEEKKYVISGDKVTITINMDNEEEVNNFIVPTVSKDNINFAAWQIDGNDVTINTDYLKNLSEDVTTINLKAYYKENPTCTLSVDSSAVVSLKSSDIVSYGISNSSTQTFNNSTYTITDTGTVYGYVKDKYGFTGSCSMSIGNYGCTKQSCSCVSHKYGGSCKCSTYGGTDYSGTCKSGSCYCGSGSVYSSSCWSRCDKEKCTCKKYGCKNSGYTKINGSYCYKLN